MIVYMCCQDLSFNKAERWKVCSVLIVIITNLDAEIHPVADLFLFNTVPMYAYAYIIENMTTPYTGCIGR